MLVLLALAPFLACSSPAQADEGQSGGLEVAVYEYECVEDASGSAVLADLPTVDAIYQIESCSTDLGLCVPQYVASGDVRREGLQLYIPCGGGFGSHADQVRWVVIQ